MNIFTLTLLFVSVAIISAAGYIFYSAKERKRILRDQFAKLFNSKYETLLKFVPEKERGDRNTVMKSLLRMIEIDRFQGDTDLIKTIRNMKVAIDDFLLYVDVEDFREEDLDALRLYYKLAYTSEEPARQEG